MNMLPDDIIGRGAETPGALPARRSSSRLMPVVRRSPHEDVRAALAREGIGDTAAAVLARLVGIDAGRAQAVLDDHGAPARLACANLSDLRTRYALSKRQAARLHDVLCLGLLLAQGPAVSRPRIRTPEDVAALMRPHLAGLTHEEVWVVVLDMAGRCLVSVQLYVGTVNACPVRVAEVFHVALCRNAPRIILVHNHPSGETAPSPDDIHLTRDIVRAGRLLDVTVLDHVIIAAREHTSMRRAGLGWEETVVRPTDHAGNPGGYRPLSDWRTT